MLNVSKNIFSVSKIEKSQYNVNSKQDLGVGGGGLGLIIVYFYSK